MKRKFNWRQLDLFPFSDPTIAESRGAVFATSDHTTAPNSNDIISYKNPGFGAEPQAIPGEGLTTQDNSGEKLSDHQKPLRTYKP